MLAELFPARNPLDLRARRASVAEQPPPNRTPSIALQPTRGMTSEGRRVNLILAVFFVFCNLVGHVLQGGVIYMVVSLTRKRRSSNLRLLLRCCCPLLADRSVLGHLRGRTLAVSSPDYANSVTKKTQVSGATHQTINTNSISRKGLRH